MAVQISKGGITQEKGKEKKNQGPTLTIPHIHYFNSWAEMQVTSISFLVKS